MPKTASKQRRKAVRKCVSMPEQIWQLGERKAHRRLTTFSNYIATLIQADNGKHAA